MFTGELVCLLVYYLVASVTFAIKFAAKGGKIEKKGFFFPIRKIELLQPFWIPIFHNFKKKSETNTPAKKRINPILFWFVIIIFQILKNINLKINWIIWYKKVASYLWYWRYGHQKCWSNLHSSVSLSNVERTRCRVCDFFGLFNCFQISKNADLKLKQVCWDHVRHFPEEKTVSSPLAWHRLHFDRNLLRGFVIIFVWQQPCCSKITTAWKHTRHHRTNHCCITIRCRRTFREKIPTIFIGSCWFRRLFRSLHVRMSFIRILLDSGKRFSRFLSNFLNYSYLYSNNLRQNQTMVPWKVCQTQPCKCSPTPLSLLWQLFPFSQLHFSISLACKSQKDWILLQEPPLMPQGFIAYFLDY